MKDPIPSLAWCVLEVYLASPQKRPSKSQNEPALVTTHIQLWLERISSNLNCPVTYHYLLGRNGWINRKLSIIQLVYRRKYKDCLNVTQWTLHPSYDFLNREKTCSLWQEYHRQQDPNSDWPKKPWQNTLLRLLPSPGINQILLMPLHHCLESSKHNVITRLAMLKVSITTQNKNRS